MPLVEQVKSYIYLGHGADVSLVNNKSVPKGSTLSTIAEAGIAADLAASLNLCNITYEHKDLLQDPVKNKRVLRDMFLGKNTQTGYKEELSRGRYHFKNEDSLYKDKFCDFFFKFGEEDNIAMFRSGFYEIIDGLELPRLIEGSLFDSASINVPKDGYVRREDIERIYAGSLYPTAQQIIQELESYDPIPFSIFQQAVRKVAIWNVSQLMDKYPGNHYYFVCRSPLTELSEENYNALSKERAASRNEDDDTNPHSWLLEHNFKRTITRIYNRVSSRPTKTPYKSMLGYIKWLFNKFNTLGEKMEQVNVTIQMLNKALEQNKFRESDMDIELIKLIHESQHHGATEYINYSTLIDRILTELYGEHSYRDHTRSRFMIVSSFRRFIEEKGQVNEALKRIVIATIKVIGDDPSDQELYELIQQSKQYKIEDSNT
jgi:hypothetical protein